MESSLESAIPCHRFEPGVLAGKLCVRDAQMANPVYVPTPHHIFLHCITLPITVHLPTPHTNLPYCAIQCARPCGVGTLTPLYICASGTHNLPAKTPEYNP